MKTQRQKCLQLVARAILLVSVSSLAVGCVDNTKRQIELPKKSTDTVDFTPPPAGGGGATPLNPGGNVGGGGNGDVNINLEPKVPTTPTTPTNPNNGTTNVGVNPNLPVLNPSTPVTPTIVNPPVNPPVNAVTDWDGASDLLTGGWKLRDL